MNCPNCGSEVTSLVGKLEGKEFKYRCKNCTIIHKELPSIHGCDSFNPHYDLQLDRFFETREQKKAYLQSKGLFQVSGTDSPRRTEGKGRLVCSETQYRNGKHKL